MPTIEILDVCNNLEKGYFRSNARMKEALYLFAFAFDMVVDPADANGNPRRDICKNLFEDFYSDNIVRYLDEDYSKSGGSEEPTGITVQYKNFAELVYLYWLNKKDIAPVQKYTAANAMIEDIVSAVKAAKKKSKASEKEAVIAERKEYGTEIYREMYDGQFYDEKIKKPLTMSPEEFKAFILENYDIDPKLCGNKGWQTNIFDNENAQERASIIFTVRIKETGNVLRIVEKMPPKKKSDDENSNKKEKTELSVDVAEILYYPLEMYKWFVAKQKNLQADPRTAKLSTLLEKVNEKIDEIYRNGQITLTRTSYLYLYYNWFVSERAEREHEYTKCFDDFYKEYKDQLNSDLSECSYQLFSEKNLIDMLLLYSAFIILRTDIPLKEPENLEQRLEQQLNEKLDKENKNK